MIAVGANRGIVRAVRRAARVVVNHRLVIKIDDVKRAIRSDAGVDGAKPQVAAADEFLLLLSSGKVARSDWFQKIVVDDIDGRLGTEMRAIPLRRPGAAIINTTARHRGVTPDQIDLDVSLLGP